MNRDQIIKAIEDLLDEGYNKHIPLTASFLADGLIKKNVPDPEWISVKEKLPDEGSRFLCYSKWKKITVQERRSWGDRPYTVGGLDFEKDILYRKPLPEIPKIDAFKTDLN